MTETSESTGPVQDGSDPTTSGATSSPIKLRLQEIRRPRSKGGPSAHEINIIRRLLYLPEKQPLPRCPAKDQVKCAEFEAAGSFDHVANNHICDECRCHEIAGAGTWRGRKYGDFWGLGEHTGHYGVGYCHRHERGRPKSKCYEFARNQMINLQTLGKAPTPQGERMQLLKLDARIAQERHDIREGMEMVKQQLAEMFAKLNSVDGLKENGPGGLRPVSDVTKYKLVLDFAKVISQLAKDEYTVSAEDYIHVDDIKIRIPQMMSVTYRFIIDERQRAMWLEEFSSLFRSLKPRKG